MTSRYYYVLLVLSHDQISPLCLIQALKISSQQNTKACPRQWASKLYFGYSNLQENFLTRGNARNIIEGPSKITDLICCIDHSEMFFPQFSVSL